MIANLFEVISGAIFNVLGTIFGMLPAMPYSVSDFIEYMDNNLVINMVSWMNYFLPIGEATAIISVWATAMMSYVGVKLAIKYGNRVI